MDADWVVMPSVWWENAPLVIAEAHAHGRPVICSNIGGMAESVRHGVDGLHFPAGDAADSQKPCDAPSRRRAMGSPEAGYRALPYRFRGCQEHRKLYDDLMWRAGTVQRRAA